MGEATPPAGPLLFLSHAGVDTDAALDLALRLEATPAAREAGLRVWIDQRNLAPGRGWQHQLEDAIEKQSTAFAVLVRAGGAVNWVEAEVRVALSRATKDDGYPFVPVLVGEARSADLPAFARRYHAVRALAAADPELLRALLAALLRPEGRGPVAVVEHPFVGLASFSQETAELFHGRKKEAEELVERLGRTNLVMVVGDSGSGKSSLVRAGLVPRFRGGAFADPCGERPDPSFWQVVEMRPQAQPFERLVDAVSEAATKAGIGAHDRGALANWVRTCRPEKIRDAIRDSAPPPAKALLLVDQFEELWTLAPEAERKAFVEALLGVAEAAGEACRVVLTMRRDYYNLSSQFPALFERLEAPEGAAKYQVRRMDNASLREAIMEPLRLTDAWDEQAVATFADAVLKDIGDRPGDLALLEVALAEAWRHRRAQGGRLLDAYVARGRVAGALANAAEDVFQERLADAPLDTVKGVFVRLVHLGDTGGTTRRIARRAEFTDETWPLVQRLAGGALPARVNEIKQQEHARLVSITGEPGRETVEIAHEALATQWPRYQAWLQDAAPEKRVFDRLIEEAAEWAANGEDARRLAQGADLEVFAKLRRTRVAWLSEVEDRFVRASEEAESARADRERTQAAEREQMLQQLILLNSRAVARHLLAEAQRLIIRDNADTSLALRLTAESLRRAPSSTARSFANELIAKLPRPQAELPSTQGASHFSFSPDGRLVAFACGTRIQVWQCYHAVCKLDQTFGERVKEFRFDGRGALVILLLDGKVRRVSLALGRESLVAEVDGRTAVLAHDARRVAWARGSTAFVKFLDDLSKEPLQFKVSYDVRELALSPAGPELLVYSAGSLFSTDYLVRLIDTNAGSSIDLADEFHMDLAFSPDGRFATARGHGSTRVWSVADGALQRRLPGDLAGWTKDPAGAVVGRSRLMRTDEPMIQQYELFHWRPEYEDPTWFLRLDGAYPPFRVFELRGRTMLAFAARDEVHVIDARLGTAVVIVPHQDKPEFAVSPRGDRLATSSKADAVRTFSLTPERHRTIGPFTAPIGIAAASRDGSWLARSLDHAEGADFGALPPFKEAVAPRASTQGRVSRIVVSDDGTVAAMTESRRIISAKGASDLGAEAVVIAQPTGTYELPRAAPGLALAITADGRSVAEVQADGVACWLDADDWQAPATPLPTAGAKDVEFDGEGRYLLVSGEGRIDLFDCAAGFAHLLGRDEVACACFAGPSRLCLVDRSGRLYRYALPDTRPLPALPVPFVPTALLPSGEGASSLLAIVDHAVVILDGESGRVAGRMDHLEPVSRAASSPSGRHLLVATRDRRTFVWDIAETTQLFEVDEPDAVAVWLADDCLAIRRGNRFDLEPVSSDALWADALGRTGPLTQQEWQTYLPDEPWPGFAPV